MSSVALVWALAASVVVHAGVIIATRTGGAIPGAASIAPRVIEAVLAPAQTSAEPAMVAAAAPSVITAKEAPPSAPPSASSAAPSVAPETAAPKARRRGVAAIAVIGEPITDKTRLGSYLSRQLSEFRAEIDRPVRLRAPIVVPYPTAALRAGREDSVSLWIVVDDAGQADEVNVIEGAQEFVNDVVAAVFAAKFEPAEQALQPIRYPIALEFRFRVTDPDAVAQANGAR